MRRTRRNVRSSGAVSVEFLIAFPALWTFCLCIFQVVLLGRADLVVRHAAESAARSAAVVLPDDPARYRGEPEMSVSRKPDVGSDSTARAPLGTSPDDVFGLVMSLISLDGRSRRETIEAAVEVPLLSLGATRRVEVPKPTLHSSIGPSGTMAGLSSGSPAFELAFSDTHDERVRGPEVTVRVTYSFPCRVPIARHIICESQAVGMNSGLRVWRFDHSTTLLIHDAPYSYRKVGQS